MNEKYLAVLEAVTNMALNNSVFDVLDPNSYYCRYLALADRVVLFNMMHTKPYLDLNFARVYATNTGIEKLDKNGAYKLLNTMGPELRDYYYGTMNDRINMIYMRYVNNKVFVPVWINAGINQQINDLIATLDGVKKVSYAEIQKRAQSLIQSLALVEYTVNNLPSNTFHYYNKPGIADSAMVAWCPKAQEKFIKLIDPEKILDKREQLSIDQEVILRAQLLTVYVMIRQGFLTQEIANVYEFLDNYYNNGFGKQRADGNNVCCPCSDAPDMAEAASKYKFFLPNIHPSTLLCMFPDYDYEFESEEKSTYNVDSNGLCNAYLIYYQIRSAMEKELNNIPSMNNANDKGSQDVPTHTLY